jgi:hypothetical protein
VITINGSRESTAVSHPLQDLLPLHLCLDEKLASSFFSFLKTAGNLSAAAAHPADGCA